MKHLVRTQLINDSMTNQSSGGSRDLTISPHLLPSDQRPYFQYVSSALKLHGPPPGMQIIGGSTVLKSDELTQLSVTYEAGAQVTRNDWNCFTEDLEKASVLLISMRNAQTRILPR